MRELYQRTDHAEPDDFYATDPIAALDLLDAEPQLRDIWEPACGMGHLSKVFEMKGVLAKASDIADRGCIGAVVQNFFDWKLPYDGDIVTNPPYSIADDFILHALDILKPNRYACMFLELNFLAGLKRYEKLFKDNPPVRVHIFSRRVPTARRGNFEQYKRGMKSYAWFVWRKGYKGSPKIKWR